MILLAHPNPITLLPLKKLLKTSNLTVLLLTRMLVHDVSGVCKFCPQLGSPHPERCLGYTHWKCWPSESVIEKRTEEEMTLSECRSFLAVIGPINLRFHGSVQFSTSVQWEAGPDGLYVLFYLWHSTSQVSSLERKISRNCLSAIIFPSLGHKIVFSTLGT